MRASTLGMLGYYAAVVGRVRAGGLARAAARRAYRLAQSRLYRPGAGPGELSSKVLDDRSGLGWCEVAQRGRLLEALEAVPGARERALSRAERAAARDFQVFGTRVRFGEGGRTDWSLDPVSGERYAKVPAGRIRLSGGGADPKFPWALGRLDHLVALGQGYWAAAPPLRPRYADAFACELDDFLRENPAGIGIQWASPMEVALRAANIAQAFAMFADAAPARDPARLRRVLGALSDHASFVEANLEDHGLVPNNHLVANYLGLLVVGLLFPSLPGAPRWIARAAGGLRREIRSQVHPGGMSFEGSVPYHRLATEMFALAHVVARSRGVDLGQAYAEQLGRMFRRASAYCSEGGLAPQIGDNDSGRAIPLRARASLDHGYLASLGAALLADPELKRAGEPLCDEALWLLGPAGVARFGRLEPLAAPTSFASEREGIAVLRGAGAVVAASVGGSGQRGVGGHSHNDKLSFELHLRGIPVIVDPGSPTYTRDPRRRNAFRATGAHNTPELDGAEQAPFDPARLFSLPGGVCARVTAFEDGEAIARLSARHSGYARLAGGVDVERAWVLDRGRRALGVCDLLLGFGRHQLVSRFHLPDGEARLRPITALERTRARGVSMAPRELAGEVVELGPAGSPRAALAVEAGARVALAPAEYSPGYGEVRPALAVEVRTAVEAPARIGVVVLWGEE